ncbi:hypothetical protein Tco_0519571 [Tanacetum coccineum]
MKTRMRPVNVAKPKAAYKSVKRNSASVTNEKNWITLMHKEDSNRCTGSGEARVQQRKKNNQRRVQQKQKDQEDEVFGRILSARK